VTQYIANGAAKWFNVGDSLRKESLELARAATGLSQKMLERDYWMIAAYLMHRTSIYDLLDSELGDHHMMDEWVRRQTARVRAFPRGRTLHIMVGNVRCQSPRSTAWHDRS
jgi:long-chain-fatty-acyl-CoA reductase